MPIKGDLSRIDLSDIFQMLTLNQNEGTLNIYYEGVHRSVYFNGNDIIKPFDPDTMEDRILSLLVRQGKLTEEQVERARYNTETLQTGLLGALAQMRYVTEEDVHYAYILNMEEDIYELFLVKDAQFEFLEGEKPSAKETMDTRFTLSPNNLLMEAVRRGDEWAHIRELIPSGVEVFEVTEDGLPEGISDENGEYALILQAMDGIRSVNRIIEETRLHRFTVFKICSVLLESGKIAPVDNHQLVLRGDDCIQNSRVWDAIDLYERAIAAGIVDPALFEKVGNAYKSVSENKKAVQHFNSLCELLETKGALKQAVKIYHMIRELMPTEIVARERIFLLYLNNYELFEDLKYDAMAEGTELALIFKELGRFQSALEVVNLLFETYQDNSPVLEELAKLALDVQSSATALMILEHLGGSYLQERDSTNALRIFRRIKYIDPEYRGIDDKLDRLMIDDLEQRSRRSRIVKTVTLVGVLVSLFFAYFLFNSFAFDAYTSINHGDLMASTDFRGSRAVYEDFCAKFPLSIYWFLAKEKLSTIETTEECYKKAETLRTTYEAEERIASQQSAENLYQDAMVYLDNAELENALRLFRKSAEAATDRAWLEETGVRERVEELENYFSEAASLQEQADALMEAGKFGEAHGLLVRLARAFPYSDEARAVEFPLLVKTDPSGARVEIKEEGIDDPESLRTGVTPVVLHVLPSRSVEVRVEKEGFMPEKRVVDAYSNDGVDIDLFFKAESVYSAGPGLLSAPVPVGDGFLLAFKDGRIKRMDAGTGAFAWVYNIENLESLTTPLGVSEERALFCWGDRRITALSIRDGKPEWTQELAFSPVQAPLEQDGYIYVLMEKGKLCRLDALKGVLQGELDLKCGFALQAVPWKSGVILALEDGRILWLDGESGKVGRERTVPDRPTSICCDGDRLLVGNSKGGIDCFLRDSGEAVFTFQTDETTPVDQLVSRGARVFALKGGNRVVSIDTARLKTTGEFLTGSKNLWLCPPGGDASVQVGSSGSMIYLLRSSDLSLIKQYRTEGEIGFPGLSENGHAYFYSSDGKLNGVRF